MSELLARVTTAVAEAREKGGSDEEIAAAAIRAVKNPTSSMLRAMAMCEDREGSRNPKATFNAAIEAGLA